MDYQAILSAERRADLSARGLWLNRLFSDALDDVAARTPDALAIVVGRQLGARLPDRIVKVGATLAFVVFGVYLIVTGLG